MTQNGIRPEGISHLITSGLSKCKELEVFDLQDNTFTFKGAQALATAVSGWSGLNELGIGVDLLGARGSVKVFEALATGETKSVEVLRLAYNDITPVGVKALLQAAENGLPRLRRVELNGNKFDEDDASIEALAALLSERKDEHGKDHDPEDHWGLDDLDELEGEDEDDEEEEDEEEEAEDEQDEEDDLHGSLLKDADQAENAIVSQKKDADVDELASALEKTHV